MSHPLNAEQVLDREFLEIRAKILEVAASLDRLQRAEGTVTGDPRMERLREAVHLLLDQAPDRAENVQLLFSRAYEDDWQAKYGLERA